MTELLTIDEGARDLRLSIHTIRHWVRTGRLTHVRLGRRIMLRRSDLERLVRDNVVKASK